MYTLGSGKTLAGADVVEILDPAGDFVCWVLQEYAQDLLWHLNRNFY